MRTIPYSVRLTAEQFHALIELSHQRGSSRYSALSDVIQAGFETISSANKVPVELANLANEVASISVRLLDVERLVDRTLYTSCASYAFARNASQQRRVSEQTTTEEIREAYERQRLLAEEIIQ